VARGWRRLRDGSSGTTTVAPTPSSAASGQLRPVTGSSSKLIFYCSHRSSHNEFGACFGLAAVVKKRQCVSYFAQWHNKESNRFCDRTSTWPSYEFRKGLLKKKTQHIIPYFFKFLGVLSNRKIKYCKWEFNWNNKSRKNCHEQVNKRDNVSNKLSTVHSQQSVQIPSLCTSELRGTRWTGCCLLLSMECIQARRDSGVGSASPIN
jgi:hypothetical protein